MRTSYGTAAALIVLAGCSPRPPHAVPADSAGLWASATDSAFSGVQARGESVMSVNQNRATHVFEDLPIGGRIILDANDPHSASIAVIRRHMREIAADFRNGDFAKPFAVHAQEVPGTAVMSARRNMIEYSVADRARGAEVRIETRDSLAVIAIHAFLAFQRSDHRASGHDAHGSAAH